MIRIAEILILIMSPVNLYLRLNMGLWRRLPSKLRDTPPMRAYGTILHRLVCRHANRRQATNTFFFRNRPELELMRHLTGEKHPGSTLMIVGLGLSIRTEVYVML